MKERDTDLTALDQEPSSGCVKWWCWEAALDELFPASLLVLNFHAETLREPDSKYKKLILFSWMKMINNLMQRI